MSVQKRQYSDETYLTLTDKCNQNCVFCSAFNKSVKQDPCRIASNINREKISLNVGGWEPTLVPDLLVRWVRKASKSGIKEVIVRTNALVFAENKQLIQDVVDAGATTFSVNFPAHTEKLCDRITRTRGNHPRRLKAIRSLIEVAGGDMVRLTVVIHNLNYSILPEYARFVAREFPSISYIGLNMACVEGRVEDNPELVPKLTDVNSPLARMVKFCKEKGIKTVTDGIPLCFMDGFEDVSVDVSVEPERRGGDSSSTHHKQCKVCSLSKICAGLPNDYFKIYGAGELKSSTKSVRTILENFQKRGYVTERLAAVA